MKRFLLAALAVISAFVVSSVAVSCSYQEEEEPLLEVNRNNISGSWQLVDWKGQGLEEGTFFRLSLVRNDETFVIEQNLDSFGDVPRVISGSYSLEIDPAKGALISGKYDHDTGFWSHRYIITKLTSVQMTWVAEDDPDFCQVFERTE